MTVRSLDEARARRDGRLPRPADDTELQTSEETAIDDSAITAGYASTLLPPDLEWLPGSEDGPTAAEMLALHEAARSSQTEPYRRDARGARDELADIEDFEDRGVAHDIADASPGELEAEDQGAERSVPRGSAELAPQRRQSGKQHRARRSSRASNQGSSQRRPSKTQERSVATKPRPSGRRAALTVVAFGAALIAAAGLWFGTRPGENRQPSFDRSVVSASTTSKAPWMAADALAWGTDPVIVRNHPRTVRVRARPKSDRVHRQHVHKSTSPHTTKPAATEPTTSTRTSAPATAITQPVEPSSTATRQRTRSAATSTQAAPRSSGTKITECGGAGVLAPTNCGRPSL